MPRIAVLLGSTESYRIVFYPDDPNIEKPHPSTIREISDETFAELRRDSIAAGNVQWLLSRIYHNQSLVRPVEPPLPPQVKAAMDAMEAAKVQSNKATMDVLDAATRPRVRGDLTIGPGDPWMDGEDWMDGMTEDQKKKVTTVARTGLVSGSLLTIILVALSYAIFKLVIK